MSFRVSVFTLILLAGFGFKSIVQSDGKMDGRRALLEDRERFKYLSQAAQNLLQRRFGLKPAGKISSLRNPESPLIAPANVLVNNPAADFSSQDTQSTAAITLASGTNLVVAFTDSGSFTGLNNHFSGYSTSADSGASFTDRGTLPDPGEGDSGSPVLARNATNGTIYLSTLGFLSGEMIPVFRSSNNGVTFNAPINATPGYVTSGDFLDKPWLAVDNGSGAGQGNVYVVWRHFPFSGSGSIRFTKSTDGGSTWGPNLGTEIVLASTGSVQGPNVVVGSNHNVYVFWFDQTTSTRQIKVRRSTDQGSSFATAVNVTNLVTAGNNGNLNLNGGFTTNAFPQAAVNPINNHVYVVYNDDVPGVDKANIYLRRSTDAGATWGTSTQVNGDTTNNDQFHPSIAVTPDGSRALVSWHDRRNDLGNSKIERFGKIYSVDGAGNLVSLGEFLISSSNFPVATSQDPEVVPGYMGEYDQAAADNMFFYIPWGDNRDGNIVHKYQPDVRFAKVSVNGPGPVLTLSSSTLDDAEGNNNGAVDQDECIRINVTLQNQGNSTATAITSVLSSSTPEVSVTQPNSAYLNIAPGATGSNLQPFDVSTSSGFDCEGIDIDFVLTVTTADGTYQIPFVIRSGGIGPELQFDMSAPVEIPDLNSIDIPLVASGISGTLGRVRASVQIQHTADSDLDLYLISPDNTIVELSTDNGGSSDNYGTACVPQTSRTTFDDSAVNSITSPTVSVPYAGTFRPEGNLSDFRGKTGSAVNGTWFLRVTDDSGIDTGTVNCFSLFLAPITCIPGNGACAPACLFCDNFEDGILAPNWTYIKLSWNETGGSLIGTPVKKKAMAVATPAFAGCINCSVKTSIMTSGGPGNRISILGWFVNNQTYVELMMKEENDRWILRQRSAGSVVAKKNFQQTIEPNVSYEVEVNYDGVDFEVLVDGVSILTMVPGAPVLNGTVGLQSRNGTGMFAEIEVN